MTLNLRGDFGQPADNNPELAEIFVGTSYYRGHLPPWAHPSSGTSLQVQPLETASVAFAHRCPT